MALSHKSRRRFSMLILLIGLPAYIVAAIVLVAQFDRPSILVEMLIYVVLGVGWIIPFKFIFSGIGKADPEADKTDDLELPK